LNKTYCFLDRDDQNPHAEFDLEGEQFLILLDTATKYCAYFSFDIFHGGVGIPENMTHGIEQLCKFEISPQKSILKRNAQNNSYWFEPTNYATRHYYYYSPAARSFIKKNYSSIFSLIFHEEKHNPENLIFYRPDYSIFFLSTTHEGECFLFPSPNENVKDLLCNSNWKKII